MKKQNTNETKQAYSYYSRVLEKPFDSLNELASAEATYYEQLKQKEDKAAQKKADAKIVEDAFKQLNATRKSYKEDLSQLTQEYSDALANLKKAYDAGKADIQNKLATAEQNYKDAIKNFGAKYPEGYHMTLKDGDFETTISSQTTKSMDADKVSADAKKVAEIFNMLFGW
jgi:chromosome segregation ATPase